MHVSRWWLCWGLVFAMLIAVILCLLCVVSMPMIDI